MGKWRPLHIHPGATWSDFISGEKKSGEKVEQGCGSIKLQENVAGTTGEKGNKECMRLANGNSAKTGEIVKR